MKFLFNKIALCLFIMHIVKPLYANQMPQFYIAGSKWADSVLSKMTLDEKIGQLFMVAAYSNKDSNHVKQIIKLIEKYNIGGLIFFQGGPVRQANLTNLYQSKSKIPLMIGIDAEWGLRMRLDSTIRFPKQTTLGALQNDTLIYAMGAEIARQSKRLGVHINFAPVVDINSNPNNPVIGNRSFGENKFLVTRKSLAYMLGLQNNKVLACAKHFPGHGDAAEDSHYTLPVLNHPLHRFDTLELFPYKKLLAMGVSSVMIAHLQIPAINDTLPASLSKKIITDILKNQMHFAGLIFTDALNMKAVSNLYKPGELEVLALAAGNDVLLFSEDVPRAFESIKEAINKKTLSIDRINESVRKILIAKKWLGLDNYRKIETNNLWKDLNNNYAKALNHKLFESSITLLENKNFLLPLKKTDTLKIALINFGDTAQNLFYNTLKKYIALDAFNIPLKPKASEITTLLEKVKTYNLYICAIYPHNKTTEKYGITDELTALINKLNLKSTLCAVLFGNPYALQYLKGSTLYDALLVTYENTPEAKSVAAQTIMGGNTCHAKLPVSVSQWHCLGDGEIIHNEVRFKYVLPEYLGIRSDDLNLVDSIAINGIKEKAYPGCQILAAKKGIVFYYKSFGYHTYDSTRAVVNTDVYDLASVTKILATTAALMKLNDEEKFSLDKNLGYYLPEILDSSVYAKLVIRKILAHEAGLISWIPFYLKTLDKNNNFKPQYYSNTRTDSFNIKVAENLYLLSSIKDSIFKEIKNTPLRKKNNYLYSDLGYYFIKEIIEKITKQSLDKYVDSVFYKPLGLHTLTYNPLNKIEKHNIIPTEDDKIFRKQLIHGYVHDQGAAMCGGVGGHAGLFGNANDVAVMMQMYLNYGTYGGERYLSKKVIKEYTRCQFCPSNRRGAGFDRPTMMNDKGPTCNCVSADSFGHTGFTGITVWADPGEDIVFVFLSNRSHPVGDNPKILSMNIRTRIQQQIYNAIKQAGNNYY
jgi:beta-glucosidase-like glycosyl hydrolase/CubicO group peptidase (beta-lactamase class C family)